jgi:hypothetical protein
MVAPTGRFNRVRPDGQLIAGPDRGLFWGNRGQLLDGAGELARHSRGRNWLICELQFKGRKRVQWQPRRLTELYFLDEPTALAAGHRPCGECRSKAYRRFKSAWITAHPGDPPGAAHLDARLHADRLAAPGTHRAYRDRLATLPDGTMIEVADAFWLVRGDELLAWRPSGYHQRRPRTDFHEVLVRTPKSTVDTLAAGYEPAIHPSAAHR